MRIGVGSDGLFAIGVGFQRSDQLAEARLQFERRRQPRDVAALLVGSNEQTRQILGFANILEASNILGDVVGLSSSNDLVGDEDAGDGTFLDKSFDFGKTFKSDHEATTETFEAGGIGGEDFGARQNLERPLRWTRRILGALVQGRIRDGLYCNVPFAIGLRRCPICRSTSGDVAPCPVCHCVMLGRREFPVRRTRGRRLRLKRQ